MKEAIWLRVSVFYNKREWHILMQHCICPVLKEMLQKKYLEKFFIYFSSDQGEHIRISVKSSGQVLQKLARHIDTHFKIFLIERPSAPVQVTYPFKGLFMDFPANSVYYNLYSHSQENILQESMRYHISKAILNALNKDAINTESIFTFLIYMEAGLIRALYSDKKRAGNFMIALCNNLNSKVSNEQYEVLQNKVNSIFMKNCGELIEILSEVWHEHTPSELEWFKCWETTCEKQFKYADPLNLFISLTALLYNHMGITDTRQLIISSGLLKRMLISPL